jgi:hypothetical protein
MDAVLRGELLLAGKTNWLEDITNEVVELTADTRTILIVVFD